MVTSADWMPEDDPPDRDEDDSGNLVKFPHRFVRGDHAELADALLRCLAPTRADLVHVEGALHRYEAESGLWSEVPIERQRRIVKGFAGSALGAEKTLLVGVPAANGASVFAGDEVHTPEFFGAAHAGLAFSDCFVAIESDGRVTRRPHDRRHRARVAYPFPYTPEAHSEPWDEFLAGTFEPDSDADEKIALIQEFFGAALVGASTKFQRALLFSGNGNDGKSTLLDVVQSVFPPGSVTSIPPQRMGEDYRRAKLVGKLLNVVSELPEADIIESESLKAVITGDLMEARPIREAAFDFRSVAGHAFAANRLPGTNDNSLGFWRRWIVVPCNRTLLPHQVDPELAVKLRAQDPAALAAWMIAGASRLVARGRYEIPDSCAGAVAKWRKGADQIALFVDDCCEETTDIMGTTSMRLYESYRKWAEKNGHRTVTSHKFGQRMQVLYPGARRSEKGQTYPVMVKAADMYHGGGD